ncbi:MAG: IscS subfamily cysteine desulfurase [Chrysiogenetes bacterium]|nr:IscS subfamily cysteine desulfurase [Chrysiogenetes bacterium]
MSVKLPIYMDYQATTPVDPEVLDIMYPYFTEKFGNAASRSHSFGWEAEEAVELGREQVAKLIGCSSKEIIFTSGATESDNMAILGIAEMYEKKGKHIITCQTEHKAILDPCKYLEKKGWDVTYLPVDQSGTVDLNALTDAIREDTVLVSIMAANNEIGTIAPLKEIGAICKNKGVIFHSDAAQTFGKIPMDVGEMGIDLMSISGHKIYGPKGIGALYVRRKGPRVRVAPVIHGGGHERGMRSGTLNVPGIVGLGAAAEKAGRVMVDEEERVRTLMHGFWERLQKELPEIHLNGHPTQRLAGNLNVSFAYVEGESLIMGLKGIAVSSGSACTSASLEPSHVLRAIGVEEEMAHTSIRFGAGRFTTKEDIQYVGDVVVKVVNRLRDLSPLWEMAQEGVDLKSIQWAAH